MKLLLTVICSALIGSGCKQEDPAMKALPGHRMSEVEALSLATKVFPPGPQHSYSQYHVSFKDGIWTVSCESNHIAQSVKIHDADGTMEPVTQP